MSAAIDITPLSSLSLRYAAAAARHDAAATLMRMLCSMLLFSVDYVIRCFHYATIDIAADAA